MCHYVCSVSGIGQDPGGVAHNGILVTVVLTVVLTPGRTLVKFIIVSDLEYGLFLIDADILCPQYQSYNRPFSTALYLKYTIPCVCVFL